MTREALSRDWPEIEHTIRWLTYRARSQLRDQRWLVDADSGPRLRLVRRGEPRLETAWVDVHDIDLTVTGHGYAAVLRAEFELALEDARTLVAQPTEPQPSTTPDACNPDLRKAGVRAMSKDESSMRVWDRLSLADERGESS